MTFRPLSRAFDKYFSFYGWRMVAVGCLFRLLGGGVHFYGFTVFFLPLSRDLGINRAATSLIFSIARAEGALEGPLAGYMIDRFGPRPVMLVGVIMSGLGYISLYWVDSYLTFLIVYMAVISLAFGAGFQHGPMVLANSWFIRWRGRAMALVSASIGLGGAIVTPLLAIVVNSWGWRWGVLSAGIVILGAGVPLAAMVRRSPESMGLLPDGAVPSHQSPTDRSPGEVTRQHDTEGKAKFSIWSVMSRYPFWLLTMATMIRVLALSTIIVHLVPILVWKGWDQQSAAFLVGVYALLSLPTHLVAGWFADRFNKPRVMAVCMVIAALGALFLIYARTNWLLWLFLPCFSFVEAVFPVTWATVGDLYGRERFATIRGTMGFFYQWGGFIGPVVAGALYDSTQSYNGMLWGIAALLLVCAVLYMMLSRPWLVASRT